MPRCHRQYEAAPAVEPIAVLVATIAVILVAFHQVGLRCNPSPQTSVVVALAGICVGCAVSLVASSMFKANDCAITRRQLFRTFARTTTDVTTRHILSVPAWVSLKETCWTSSRSVSLATFIATNRNLAVKDHKAILMFVHGYADHVSFLKRANLYQFVQEDIAVAALELEGHGGSDGCLGYIHDFDALVADVVEFVAHQVLRQPGLAGKPVFLMGESLGGAVSFSACKQAPSRFQGVIFVSPMCKIAPELIPAPWVLWLFLFLAGPRGSKRLTGYLPLPTALLDRLAGGDGDVQNRTHQDCDMWDLLSSTPYYYDRGIRLATARELLLASVRISSELHSFDTPFLVQHGKEDRVTSYQGSVGLHTAAASKDKTLKLYKGMQHAILGDIRSDTEIVLQDSINWLLQRI